MTIAILCPTRGRPEQCGRMIRSALDTADNKRQVIFYLAYSDDDHDNYAFIQGVRRISSPDGMPTVHKWNILAQEAIADKAFDHRLFMLGADDMIFATPGWDKALLDHYNQLENKIHVYTFRDSRDAVGTPHPIVTHEYIDAMGYFLPPIFMHWFVDTWIVNIARSADCFTHLQEFELIHDKPSDRGQPDETHNRIRRMGWHRRDSYVNETCQHFLELEKQRLAKAMQ